MALTNEDEPRSRYLAYVPEIATETIRGFLSHQESADRPAYENGRSIGFDLLEIQGYSPVQVERYWRLVRRVDPQPIYYNSASFQTLEPAVLRLLAVNWLITREGTPPPAGAEPIATEGAYTLFRLPETQPRASIVYASRTAASPAAALEAVVDPAFDPSLDAVVEGAGPRIAQGTAPPGTAEYRETSPEDVRISVTSTAAGLLVIRNVYDQNWRATIEGRPAEVHQVDYLLQGVEIPARLPRGPPDLRGRRDRPGPGGIRRRLGDARGSGPHSCRSVPPVARCRRYASMNGSRSPSSTASTLPTSLFVRWSFTSR